MIVALKAERTRGRAESFVTIWESSGPGADKKSICCRRSGRTCDIETEQNLDSSRWFSRRSS